MHYQHLSTNLRDVTEVKRIICPLRQSRYLSRQYSVITCTVSWLSLITFCDKKKLRAWRSYPRDLWRPL